MTTVLDHAPIARDGFDCPGPDMVTSIDQTGHTGIDGIYHKDTPQRPAAPDRRPEARHQRKLVTLQRQRGEWPERAAFQCAPGQTMNPRDPLFDTEHFETFIESRRADISRLGINGRKELSEIVAAMYSAGYPCEKVRTTYVEYLRATASVMPTTYPSGRDVLYLMSFALMLGVHDDERDMLAAVAAKDNCDQPFYAFLEDALGLEHPPLTGKKGTWKFFPTLQAIPNKEGKQDFIATYLKRNWYNSWRSEYWWGEHQGGAIRYFGYWAWEFGALVKAWGLDDSSFRGNRYYPADMAHYLDQN